mgnify:CR=1 FL=1
MKVAHCKADGSCKGRSVFSLAGRGIEALMVACLVTMTVLVFGNVVLRYVFNSGIAFSEEISRYLFVWLTFLGAVVGMHERAHLGMDSLVQHLPVLGKKICFGICQCLMLGCCWLFFDGSWEQTIVNLDNHAPVSNLSLAYVYGIGVFSSFCIALILLRNLYRLFTGQIGEEELIQIRESEENIDAPTSKRSEQGSHS